MSGALQMVVEAPSESEEEPSGELGSVEEHEEGLQNVHVCLAAHVPLAGIEKRMGWNRASQQQLTTLFSSSDEFCFIGAKSERCLAHPCRYGLNCKVQTTALTEP